MIAAELKGQIHQHIQFVMEELGLQVVGIEMVQSDAIKKKWSDYEVEELTSEIETHADFSLSQDQQIAVKRIAKYLITNNEYGVFVLTGSAGTGKTSLMKLITNLSQAHRTPVFLCAPTGRAAKVISKRTAKQATTLHRLIYEVVESEDHRKDPLGISFHLRENTSSKQSIFILDEGSMVNTDRKEGGLFARNSLFDDFLEYVFRANEYNKVIIIGDKFQLPPVGSLASNALSKDYLSETLMLQSFGMELKEVKRQQSGSSILETANEIRKMLLNGIEQNFYPEIAWNEKEVESIQSISAAVNVYMEHYAQQPDETVFLTYSNRMANVINKKVRKILWGEDLKAPQVGDQVMVVKNHYIQKEEGYDFIANGEMGSIAEVFEKSEHIYAGKKWGDIKLNFENGKGEQEQYRYNALLDLLDSSAASLSSEEQQLILAMRRKRENYSGQMDPYLNALQLKYGYAITTHKAQGGEWNNVFILLEGPYGEKESYYRWLYTAITRARNSLYFVKPS